MWTCGFAQSIKEEPVTDLTETSIMEQKINVDTGRSTTEEKELKDIRRRIKTTITESKEFDLQG